ncbi:MAG: lytic transglycosylase domain-containing protein [Blastocatellia bacterium]
MNNWRSDTVSVQGCLTGSLRVVKLGLVRQAGNGLVRFLFLLFCLSPAAIADELHLRDGRVIQVEEVRETGDVVWCREGRVVRSYPRAEVLRIVRGNGEPEMSPSGRNTFGGGPAGKVSAARVFKDEEVRRDGQLMTIVLRDGARFEVDEIWEEPGRIVYRMGSMQGYLERSDVVSFRPTETAASLPVEGADDLPSLQFTTGHRGLDQLIVQSATRYRLDPLLIYLVMREESGFNYRAVSRVGARGLMQLMPATARQLGIRNIHNPIENVEAGTRYLRGLLETFGGDVNLALAAYNAGESAVMRYGRRIPPYEETRRYVWRINTAYRRLKGE